jgi:hypothetical protein
MNSKNPFLKTLAVTVCNEYGSNLGDICLVFPNRRSGLFFKKYLSEATANTTWSPRIFTISEFILELTGLQIADPVDLVFEAYEAYRHAVKDAESIDEFWSWGEMMLSDFDDIDKYLVNAASLYRNIRDLKEIDTQFDYTDEQKETIRKFWGHFKGGEISKHKESFLKIWNIMLEVYNRLGERLSEKGLAYEGMVYRSLAEKIHSGNYPDLPWEKVIICGFNALNLAEKELFRWLSKNGKGKFYWDYDLYYTDSTISGYREAGRFMQSNLKEFPPEPIPDTFNNIRELQVKVYELPSDIAQAKYLATILEGEKGHDWCHLNHTAVILGDEDLLIPVLTSLPAGVDELNITMGYPMSSTPVFSFTEKLLRMQKNIGSHKGRRKDKFYYRDVLSILNHQYLKITSEEFVLEKISEIHKKNLVYLEQDFFKGNNVLELIFRKATGIDELSLYLREILVRVAGLLVAGEEDMQSGLEREYIYHLLTRLNKISGIFEGREEYTGTETFSRVFRKVLKSLRISFEGEPLAGVQVMGILESRLLDFEHVVLLSINENVMPRAHSSLTFIPQNLRIAFGMPSGEDQDAIYAYYFFRLLQRAGRVTVFYNSKSDGTGTGERSRYLYQLQYDQRFQTEFYSIGFNISSREAVPVTISKTPAVEETLNRFRPPSPKYLSPSALNNYLTCRLRFYFSNLAGLKEMDTVSEDIEADTFGNLLHLAMADIYLPFKGATVTSGDINILLEPHSIKAVLDAAFRKEYYKNSGNKEEVVPEGKNIIVYEVLRSFISRILEIDRDYAPFEILEIEEEIRIPVSIRQGDKLTNLQLGGRIDRIDRKGSCIRVIDYKTGKAETAFGGTDSVFDRNSSKRSKPAFQTLLYSWLYSRKTGHKPVIPGLYITRKIFQPDYDPILTSDKKEYNFAESVSVFEEMLLNVLTEITDIKIPYDQTGLVENCEYCPYADICHRK